MNFIILVVLVPLSQFWSKLILVIAVVDAVVVVAASTSQQDAKQSL